MVAVGSWGRLSRPEHDVRFLRDAGEVVRAMDTGGRPGLAHGMGRSYGDECLNPDGVLWNTTGLDHFIAFDDTNGRLVCEAGVLLRDIQRLAIPQGWILAVTPGTQFVTVGGAIANDVHGKNHHVVGSFGDHVREIALTRTDGTVMRCGPDHESEWFAATVGGMGLTGVITRAEIQLRRVPSAWIGAQTIPFEGLPDFFRLADGSEADWEHTVSWIDCASSTARGLFMRGNPVEASEAQPDGKPIRFPVSPPLSLINSWSLRPFNAAYYHLKKNSSGTTRVPYQSFFYPLDNILEWNRVYGPRGFYQYQSVVPRDVGPDAVREMLTAIAQSGEGSFLAVLKTFGDRLPVGLMSFPRPGVTLALDFANNGDRTHRLFSRLDDIVRAAKGRIYPAKDARMPRDLFESGYPDLARFLRFRDPGISSAMSRRLMGS